MSSSSSSKQNRQQALEHTRRIMKPGGRFVIHVHNFWFNLYDPGGPWWVLKSCLRAMLPGEFERGDKFFPYRGVANMYLHVFTPGEIKRALRQTGFEIEKVIPLDPRRHQELRFPWLLGTLRANGWILVCR